MPRAIIRRRLCLRARRLGRRPGAEAGRPRAALQVQPTQQDHKLMMEALEIKSLRQGANGMNRNAPNAANYDESKVKPYPDCPTRSSARTATKVTTPEQWWTKRRPEIVEDFDREVYGRVPKDVPKVTWEVTEHDRGEGRRRGGRSPRGSWATSTTRRARRSRSTSSSR